MPPCIMAQYPRLESLSLRNGRHLFSSARRGRRLCGRWERGGAPRGDTGLNVGVELLVPCTPLSRPAVRVLLPGAQPFLKGADLQRDLRRFATAVSRIVVLLPLRTRGPKLVHVTSLQRQTFTTVLKGGDTDFDVTREYTIDGHGYTVDASTAVPRCCGVMSFRLEAVRRLLYEQEELPWMSPALSSLLRDARGGGGGCLGYGRELFLLDLSLVDSTGLPGRSHDRHPKWKTAAQISGTTGLRSTLAAGGARSNAGAEDGGASRPFSFLE
ncbi:unnamed protein product [Lampetra planeri]